MMKESTHAHARYRRWIAALACAAVACISLVSAPALAGTPIEVPVQGLLTDSDGQAIDGETQVTFRIYPDATSSQVVWESQVSLSVDMGLFETALGAGEELDSDIFSGHPDAHLSINIAGDDESTRMRLGTVPTAAHALTADTAEEAHTLQGQTPDDLVGNINAGDVNFDDSQAQLGADNSQAALEALLARVEALEQDKQAMQTQIDDNESAVAALDTRVTDVETDTSGIQSQITANETRSQNNETELQSLQSTVTSNSSALATVQTTASANASDISSLQSTTSANASDISSLQSATNTNSSAIASLQSTTSANASDISSLQSTTSANSSNISSLQTKTASMSATTVNGQDAVTFDGVNVYVRDGSGTTTGSVNGTGNLIVGYNETRSTGSDQSGSHNLIVGRHHNYTSYGGIVAGDRNDITDSYASVLGGTRNIASYTTAVVVAGYGNEASGFRSAVVSGWQNVASGSYSAVLSGDNNTVTGSESSIGGGNGLTNSSYTEFLAEGTVNAP